MIPVSAYFESTSSVLPTPRRTGPKSTQLKRFGKLKLRDYSIADPQMSMERLRDIECGKDIVRIYAGIVEQNELGWTYFDGY